MYAIWIALQDTNEHNGAVFLIERSQNLFKSYISASYNNHKINREEIDTDFVKTLLMKVGDVLIFCDSIFHGSFSNLSDSERVAATARITDKDAPFVYYHQMDKNTAGIFTIQPADLIKYFSDLQQGQIPKHLILKGTFPYQHTPVNGKVLNYKLKITHGKPVSLFEKIKKLFV